MENKKIHIALAADSNYIIPVTVVLQSLFDNNEGENISIYLLYLENTLKEADEKELLTDSKLDRNKLRVFLKQDTEKLLYSGFACLSYYPN